MCMRLLPAYVGMHHVCALCLQRPEVGAGFPGTGLRNGCKATSGNGTQVVFKNKELSEALRHSCRSFESIPNSWFSPDSLSPLLPALILPRACWLPLQGGAEPLEFIITRQILAHPFSGAPFHLTCVSWLPGSSPVQGSHSDTLLFTSSISTTSANRLKLRMVQLEKFSCIKEQKQPVFSKNCTLHLKFCLLGLAMCSVSPPLECWAAVTAPSEPWNPKGKQLRYCWRFFGNKNKLHKTFNTFL